MKPRMHSNQHESLRTHEVTYYRAYRYLKNGGMIAVDLCFGLTDTGGVLLPARKLGISDADALKFANDPDAPGFVEWNTVFIDTRQAAKLLNDPAAIAALQLFRFTVLSRYRP
jgi:hypothetical protein